MGMQSFPKAIANNLKGNIFYECEIKNIAKKDSKVIVSIEKNGQKGEIVSDVLLSTLPSYVISKLTNSLDPELTNHLNDIIYPPVLVLYLGYNKKAIKQNLDGFGFLIPSSEKKKFLGAIWSSTIFVNRSKADKAAFTIFIGGARNLDFSREQVNERVGEVLKNFIQ